MIRKYLDLIFLIILAVIVVVFRLTDMDGGFIMKITGAIFVLFAPGYAVTAAVFKDEVLEPPAKIALSIGISLALSAVGGILLYGIGASLTRTSWIVFLVIIILGGSMIAVVQRTNNLSYQLYYSARKLAFSEVLLLMLSIVMLLSSVYLAREAEQNQEHLPFTEFWMVSQSKDISIVEIGIRNFEKTDMVYAIAIRINGREVENWNTILVLPDQEWSRTYVLPSKVTLNETITAYLYTDEGQINPYRWVQLYR